MNRPRAFALASVVGAVAASPAFAITFGEPDGNDHPSVGAIIVDFDDVPYPPWHGYAEWCTATLVHPRVVLTAAHCTLDLEAVGFPDGDKDMWVSFHPDPVGRPKTWRRVSAVVTHPDYVENPAGEWVGMADPSDLAMLVLEDRVRIEPSVLPEVGFLDALAPTLGLGTDTEDFLAVGYGGQVVEEPPYEIVYYDTRWQAWMGYAGLHDTWLRTSQNPRLDNGGTCYGDSGGPVFWVDANGDETLVATTSWGDVPCVSMGFYYRTDTPAAAAFIEGVLDAVDAGAL